jgi:1,4-dihydroxy-2-naphthoyl-CoA synthase
VGKSKAMDMALTGRMMDAQEAERSGLVSRVVPLEKLMDEALGAALLICGFGRTSVMAAKEAINRAFESGLSDGVMFERRLFHSLFSTEDQKEGMDAFVNKRKPSSNTARDVKNPAGRAAGLALPDRRGPPPAGGTVPLHEVSLAGVLYNLASVV